MKLTMNVNIDEIKENVQEKCKRGVKWVKENPGTAALCGVSAAYCTYLFGTYRNNCKYNKQLADAVTDALASLLAKGD